ncbi:other 1 protein kinase, partial [Moniliophthora roreri]
MTKNNPPRQPPIISKSASSPLQRIVNRSASALEHPNRVDRLVQVEASSHGNWLGPDPPTQFIETLLPQSDFVMVEAPWKNASSSSEKVKVEKHMYPKLVKAAALFCPSYDVKVIDHAYDNVSWPGEEKKNLTELDVSVYPKGITLDRKFDISRVGCTRGPVVMDVHGNKVYLKDMWRIVRQGMVKEGDIYAKLHQADFSHIPHVVAHGDGSPGTPLQSTISSSRPSLATTDEDGERPFTHHHIIFREVGRPLVKFSTTWELVNSMKDAMAAHQEAYAKARILHRDISAGNILISEDGKEGYLIDWDFSKEVTDDIETPRQPERTIDRGHGHACQASFFIVLPVLSLSSFVANSSTKSAFALEHPNRDDRLVQVEVSTRGKWFGPVSPTEFIETLLPEPAPTPRPDFVKAKWENASPSSEEVKMEKHMYPKFVEAATPFCPSYDGTWQFMSATLLLGKSSHHTRADDLESFVADCSTKHMIFAIFGHGVIIKSKTFHSPWPNPILL